MMLIQHNIHTGGIAAAVARAVQQQMDRPVNTYGQNKQTRRSEQICYGLRRFLTCCWSLIPDLAPCWFYYINFYASSSLLLGESAPVPPRCRRRITIMQVVIVLLFLLLVAAAAAAAAGRKNGTSRELLLIQRRRHGAFPPCNASSFYWFSCSYILSFSSCSSSALRRHLFVRSFAIEGCNMADLKYLGSVGLIFVFRYNLEREIKSVRL